MSRDRYGQFASRRPFWFISGTWLLSLASVGLMLGIGNFVREDLAAFRSCSANDAGITVSSCGKQSLNVGDLILIGLLVLAAALAITLFTAAWRMTRRGR